LNLNNFGVQKMNATDGGFLGLLVAAIAFGLELAGAIWPMD